MPKKTQPVEEVLLDLEWARLYATRVKADLDEVFEALKKARTISGTKQMTNYVGMLRIQLQSANHAIGEIRKHARATARSATSNGARKSTLA